MVLAKSFCNNFLLVGIRALSALLKVCDVLLQPELRIRSIFTYLGAQMSPDPEGIIVRLSCLL